MRKALVPAVALMLFLLLAPAHISAHNVHPGFLEVIELDSGQLDVTWKVPLFKGERLDIDPLFPVGFRDVTERSVTAAVASLVERWKVVPGEGGIAGSELRI